MSDNTSSNDDGLQSPERRAALTAIRKYATMGAGASVVILSGTDAVVAQATSNCQDGTDPPCGEGGGSGPGN